MSGPSCPWPTGRTSWCTAGRYWTGRPTTSRVTFPNSEGSSWATVQTRTEQEDEPSTGGQSPPRAIKRSTAGTRDKETTVSMIERAMPWKGFPRRYKGSAITVALSLLAATAAACGSSSGSSGSAASPLTFDVYSNFTGAQASSGENFILPGARLGAKAINDAGGILGHRVNIITTDGLSDPADAVPTAQRLLAQHSGLTGIIGIGSDIAPVVVPIFNSHQIPMMSAAGTPALDRNTNSYFFRETQPDSLAGTGVAASVLAKGYKRVVMIFDSSGTSQSDAGPFLAAFKAKGGTVLANEVIQPDQPSYRTEIAKMASLHPQALVTETDPQTAGTVFSDMKQLGVLGL